MTKYQTRATTIGDFTVTISKAGDGANAYDKILAVLEFLGNRIVDPGYGIGEGRPDNSLPGGGGNVDNTLPGGGGNVDNSLPPQGGTKPTPPQGGTKPVEPDEGTPDQGLPHEKLGEFLKANAGNIAKAILRGTLCDPDRPQPK